MQQHPSVWTRLCLGPRTRPLNVVDAVRLQIQIFPNQPSTEAQFPVVRGGQIRHQYKDEIIDLFTFDGKIKAKVDSFIASSSAGTNIKLGIHIRRGDYSRWQGGRYFYDDATYVRVIREFAALFPDRKPTVYICGNDPKLDKDYYRKNLEGINVVFPDGDQAEDLYLFSQCDYLIGPPSTFSLVASMYRDVPLWRIDGKGSPVRLENFNTFDYLFKHII